MTKVYDSTGLKCFRMSNNEFGAEVHVYKTSLFLCNFLYFSKPSDVIVQARTKTTLSFYYHNMFNHVYAD